MLSSSCDISEKFVITSMGLLHFIVDTIIIYTLSIGAVKNADRIWVSTPRCTSHLGVYAAKTAKKHPSKNPTGPGTETVIFSKIDPYDVVS